MDTRSELEKFVAVLFEPTDLVEVRTFNRHKAEASRGDVQRRWVNARDLPSLIPWMDGLNREREHNIYVGVNPRMREGGKAADVALARCLFADWDDTPPERLDGLLAAGKLPPPSLAVHSGHGLHAYWKLAAPVTDFGLWVAAQQALILAAGCDAKIKDAPRVMRLPGFINLSDPEKEEADEECVVIRTAAENKYSIQEVVGEVTAEAKTAPRLPSNSIDRYSQLSRSTLQFVFAGASDGERNSRLFSAACDMAGNGYTQSDAEEKLLGPATTSGLDQGEALGTIRSAFGAPRSPAVPADTDEIGSALQRQAQATSATAAAPPPAPLPRSPAVDRRVIANVLDTINADGEPLRYHLSLPQIAATVSEATVGWPRRAGGQLFVLQEKGADIPDSSGLTWIGECDAFFAWLGKVCDVRWSMQDVQHHLSKKKLNPPTKRELFAYMLDNANPVYGSVEFLPHVPPLENTFYLPSRLPPVPPPESSRLQELVARFNPETELDRQLMLAALLTPGWGGPPGARPAFVFTSDHGRGAGKTATAAALAEIWGGCITITPKEDWDVVRKRLLSDDSMSKRILLIDNVKGRMSSGELESFITARELDGWKPYHGQASRPNVLTWYFTANSPSLSRDLADRAVIIKVGKQQHQSGFIRWSTEFIRANRAEILSEIYDWLGGEAQCRIEPATRDRWGAWQDGVLTRFDEGNEMAALAMARRPEVDADMEDAEEIKAGVESLLIESAMKDFDTRRVHIAYKQLHNHMATKGLIDKGFSLRQFNSWVRDRCGSGPLTNLNPHRKNDGGSARGWLYTGAASSSTTEIDVIYDIGPDDTTRH